MSWLYSCMGSTVVWPSTSALIGAASVFGVEGCSVGCEKLVGQHGAYEPGRGQFVGSGVILQPHGRQRKFGRSRHDLGALGGIVDAAVRAAGYDAAGPESWVFVLL